VGQRRGDIALSLEEESNFERFGVGVSASRYVLSRYLQVWGSVAAIGSGLHDILAKASIKVFVHDSLWKEGDMIA